MRRPLPPILLLSVIPALLGGACQSSRSAAAPRSASSASPAPPALTAIEVPSDPEPAPEALQAPPTTASNPDAEPSRIAPEPPPWNGTDALESNAASYVVQYRSTPAEIPWGEPFALEVWVLEHDEAGEPELAEHTGLAIDAAMPEHGHGMNRVPEVTRAGPGAFRVEGMLFHMPGRWELYFDVSEGALTERAQLEVTLE